MSCISHRTVKDPEAQPQSSDRLSRLASRVDTMTIREPRSFCQSIPVVSHSHLPIGLERSVTPKPPDEPTSGPLSLSIYAEGGAEMPWYRFCRPGPPVHSMSDSAETTSPAVVSISGEALQDRPDQENLLPARFFSPVVTAAVSSSNTSPVFGMVQPLIAVSNILQSPVMFGERLPKWSILHRSESNPLEPSVGLQPSLSPPSSSTTSSSPSLPTELVSQLPIRTSSVAASAGFDFEEAPPLLLLPPPPESRASPQTPPVSVFARRRSWLAVGGGVAPGVTRPTVLKRASALPLLTPLNLMEAASSSGTVVPIRSPNDAIQSLKRSASKGRNLQSELPLKKSRVNSLVPSERSAFLPVVHRRHECSMCERLSSVEAMSSSGPAGDAEGVNAASLLVPSPSSSN